jgi:lipid-A-disaccharide synthase
MNKKVFILTGEESGDLRASDLVNSIKKKDGSIIIKGVGGQYLKKAGCEVIYDIEHLSVVGFVEVIKKIPTLISFKRKIERFIKKFNPDLLIVVDYPGFNIPFLKWAKKRKYKTCYYILPQVWAWGEKRRYKIMKYSDLMLSIIPFEVNYFGEKCYYIGHPIAKKITDFEEQNIKKEEKYIGLFPGSRENEIKRNLPIMLRTTLFFKDEKFILNIPSALKEMTNKIINNFNLNVRINYDQYYETLYQCKFAMVSSGTATLEAALLGIPFVIIYEVNGFTYMIGKHLAKVDFIGLPNILLEREAFKEFLQNNAKPKKIYEFISKNMVNVKFKEETSTASQKLHQILEQRNYSEFASNYILKILEGNNV